MTTRLSPIAEGVEENSQSPSPQKSSSPKKLSQNSLLSQKSSSPKKLSQKSSSPQKFPSPQKSLLSEKSSSPKKLSQKSLLSQKSSSPKKLSQKSLLSKKSSSFNTSSKSKEELKKDFLSFLDKASILILDIQNNVNNIMIFRKKYKQSFRSAKKLSYAERTLEYYHTYSENLGKLHKLNLTSFLTKYNGGGLFKQSVTEKNLKDAIAHLEKLHKTFQYAQEFFSKFPIYIKEKNIENFIYVVKNNIYLLHTFKVNVLKTILKKMNISV